VRLRGGFGLKPQPAPAGQKGRIVITDDTLSPTTRANFSVTGRSNPDAGPANPRKAGGEDPVDEGASWMGRVAALRDELAKAEAELARADAANTVVAWGRLGHDYHLLMAMRNAALAPYRIRVGELRSELAGLPEECRRTVGCQPGWVR
jgi:hypothetical protein